MTALLVLWWGAHVVLGVLAGREFVTLWRADAVTS
jgi:hypothetical protein